MVFLHSKSRWLKIYLRKLPGLNKKVLVSIRQNKKTHAYEEDIFMQMAANESDARRYTSLDMRIRELAQGMEF